MKVFLTGHRGYIGGHIDWGLSARYSAVSVQRFYGDRSSFTNWRIDLEKFIAAHPPPDAVIHCGAESKVSCKSNDAFIWNYKATQLLSSHFRDVPFIYLSSCTALEPVTTFYGWSKRASSDWLASNRSNVAILIPYNVFGDEVGRRSEYSIPAKLVRGELQFAYRPWVRDYIHVKDAVDKILYVLENNLSGIYDLGTGAGVEVTELARLIGREVEIIDPTHPKYPEFGETPRVARKDKMIPGWVGEPRPYKDVRSWMEEQTTCGSC